MCSVGKKMGMIEQEHNHGHNKDEHGAKHACPHCGDTAGTCNCG